MISVAAKVAESEESLVRNHLKKVHKYLFEGLIMATLCPPFDTIGGFAAITYMLSALCFLMKNPANWLNILIFICSIFGQTLWLLVGFFVYKVDHE